MSSNFSQLLDEALNKGRYVKLAYFNNFHEFYSENVVMKTKSEGILLSNGKTIQSDWIISIDEVKRDGYEHFDDFTCDC